MFNTRKLEKSMLALKNGDDEAFEIIYDQTHRLVYYIIYSILKDKYEAEDVMQQVYMKVCEKIHTYTNSPKAWIGTIARNLAINQYNKNKRNKPIFIDDEITLKAPSNNDDTALIDLASKILDEDEFRIIMLCIVEGYKRREVAQIFNLSTSGVTWKLNNALEKLRKELQNEE